MAPKTTYEIGNYPAKGFTLIEMLVVLAIVSLLLGIAVPFFRGASQRARIKGALRGTISILNYARWMAVSKHKEIKVLVEAGCLKTGQGEEKRDYCPPSGIVLSLNREVVFLPSGEARDRACVRVENDIGQAKEVCVSSLSGKVSIEGVKKVYRE